MLLIDALVATTLEAGRLPAGRWSPEDMPAPRQHADTAAPRSRDGGLLRSLGVRLAALVGAGLSPRPTPEAAHSRAGA